jgi:hypothetical protein
LNFGVPGYQIEDMLAQWRAFARHWQPDLLLVYLANGPEDLQRSWCWYSYKRPRVFGKRVPERGTRLRALAASRVAMNAIIGYQLLSLVDDVRSDARSSAGAPEQVLGRALDGFREATERIPVAFVTLDDVATYADDPKEELGTRLRRKGFYWLDLGRVFPAPRIRFDTHLTAGGNHMVAEEVGQWLLGGGVPLPKDPG